MGGKNNMVFSLMPQWRRHCVTVFWNNNKKKQCSRWMLSVLITKTSLSELGTQNVGSHTVTLQPKWPWTNPLISTWLSLFIHNLGDLKYSAQKWGYFIITSFLQCLLDIQTVIKWPGSLPLTVCMTLNKLISLSWSYFSN